VTLRLPRSLLGQLGLLHVVVAIAAGLGLWGTATTMLHRTADQFQRDLLERQVQIVTTALTHGARTIPPVALTDGMAVALIDLQRRVATASGPRRPAILARAPLGRGPHFFRHGPVEGYSVPFHAGWIVVSQDDTDPEVVSDDIVRIFLKRFALTTLPIAALIPLMGIFLARRLTLRLRGVSAIAEAIGPRTPTVRLPVGALPVEVEPLARATNAALDRLSDALAVQSAFAADVSHELRTPLAVIRLRADALVDPGPRAAMLAAVDRAARVITQLLALAELERPLAFDAAPIDLVALAEEVVGDAAPAVFASGRSIALELVGQPRPIRGFAEAIRLALRNLIDNAVKYTAAGTAIVVSVGPAAAIVVSDNGAPLPAGDVARLKDRLWRGKSGLVEGAGIGLSIVDRIARAHDGTLTIDRGSDGRGLTCLLSLGTGSGSGTATGLGRA
jgi:two-component system OmpR family sensor kinase